MLKEFGADLKFLRESKNITIAEISAETRINPKFIVNFENGIFDFQPETYIRAFIREYAAMVDVDGYELLSDYERAKSGFYARKYSSQNIPVINQTISNEFDNTKSVNPEFPAEIPSKNLDKNTEQFEKKITIKTAKSSGEIYYGDKIKTDEDLIRSNSRKKVLQKIYVALIIAIVLVGIYFLLNYLKITGNKSITNVKPKSFEETHGEFESTYKNNNYKNLQDSLNKIQESQVKNDSLILTIKTSKDVRVKVYIDENKFVEEQILAKDSLSVKAKELFRFSASANASIDIYLNGKQLQKPKIPLGLSIKNLKINKDGIVAE